MQSTVALSKLPKHMASRGLDRQRLTTKYGTLHNCGRGLCRKKVQREQALESLASPLLGLSTLAFENQRPLFAITMESLDYATPV